MDHEEPESPFVSQDQQQVHKRNPDSRQQLFHSDTGSKLSSVDQNQNQGAILDVEKDIDQDSTPVPAHGGH